MEKTEMYKLMKLVTTLSFKKSYNDLLALNLYPGHPIILDTLYNNKDINQKKLSEMTLKEPATITIILRRMERENLIIKKYDENDKRTIKLSLTKKGIDKFNKLKSLELNTINCMFKDFDERELETFCQLLKKIKDNLEN